MAGRKKPLACGHKHVGSWTGSEFICTLPPGHRGPHQCPGMIWGEFEVAWEEYKKKGGVVDDLPAFRAGWNAGRRTR